MPRPSKSQTNNALECSNCFKLCKSEAGLTQHYNRVHLYTGYAPNGLNLLLDNPSDTTLPDSIPPDIDREVSSNEEGSIAKWIFSNEEDYLSQESNISLYDSEVNITKLKHSICIQRLRIQVYPYPVAAKLYPVHCRMIWMISG